jgi:hypothetical protein
MARKEVGATFVRKNPQPLKIVSRQGYGRAASPGIGPATLAAMPLLPERQNR